jgi:hypothetical protein
MLVYEFHVPVWIEGDALMARVPQEDTRHAEIRLEGEIATKMTDGALPGSCWIDGEKMIFYYLDEALATRSLPITKLVEEGILTPCPLECTACPGCRR